MSFIQDCLKDLSTVLGFEVCLYIQNSYTRGLFDQQILLNESDLIYVKSMTTEPTIFRLYMKDMLDQSRYPYHALSSFCLQQLPGCCGVCLSYHSVVKSSIRGKGVATRLNQFRYDLAKYLGYGALLCTDVESNLPQRKLLKNNGWKDVYSFNNPRTKNQVAISIKDIVYDESATK